MPRSGGHKTPQKEKTGFAGFEQKAKSVLWRRIVGPKKERPDYVQWKSSIEDWISKREVSRNQAVVNASLLFDCLIPVIAEYDLTEYGIEKAKKNTRSVAIPSLNVKQSFRENLRWAINAAGKQMRTKERPEECPNDAAWYLYQQALGDPKDFLAKVGQAEAKASVKEEIEENEKRQATRSIEDIDEMLASLEEEEKSNEQ